MTLMDRLQAADQRRLPDNLHRFDERPMRRATPRWIEWTRENQTLGSQDLTGYIHDGCGPEGRAA